MHFIYLFIAVTVVFLLAFLLFAIGLIVRGKILRGGCGSHSGQSSDGADACSFCSKKKISLCKTDDKMGLADVSEVGTLGRFDKK